MDKAVIIEKTKAFVKAKLSADCTGHDWWHIVRVCKLACVIAEKEGADVFIVELAALLHDIADWKFNNNDDSVNLVVASQWLADLLVSDEIIKQICDIIKSTTFKGNGVKCEVLSLEAQVVQDADRLDALGAIGIARTFAYGGFANRSMYDPQIAPVKHNSFEEYKNHRGTTINHFYEKLLILKDQMNTHTARAIAEARSQYMEQFVAQFLAEWAVE